MPFFVPHNLRASPVKRRELCTSLMDCWFWMLGGFVHAPEVLSTAVKIYSHNSKSSGLAELIRIG